MSATGNCRLNNHRFIETKLLICSLISTFPLITFRQRSVIIVPETEENILFCARYGGDTKIIYILNSEFSESKNYSFISPSSQSSITQIQLEIILNWDLDPARVKYHCSFNKAFLYSNPSKVCIHQLHGLPCDLWIAQPISSYLFKSSSHLTFSFFTFNLIFKTYWSNPNIQH